jgi:hypothetical protein
MINTANEPPARARRRPGVTGAPVPARRFLPLALLLIPVLYLTTLSQGLVFGDPTEYTFVANILGIAHPPGYAVIILLGKLFQTVVPFGAIPWRMNLLSASAAFAAALLLYGQIGRIAARLTERERLEAPLGALFAAFTVALGANFWQHAIHANPHILTAAFLAGNLFFLTSWWASASSDRGMEDRWLLAFCLSAGLGVPHHPLTVFSFPAYAVFIVLVRPQIWREGRRLLKMLAMVLLGLSLFLYYPIRGAAEPAFGPHSMATLSGFLDHVLGRGITESLPFFSLAELPDRALVFWTLLRVQYSLPTIFLALLGPVWLVKGSGRSSAATGGPARLAPAVLYGLVFLLNYAFVFSLRQQDIMAYSLGIFLVVGLLSGVGLLGLVDWLRQRLPVGDRGLALLVAGLFLLGPVLQLVRNLPHISLRQYDAAEEYQAAVFDWFEGQGEGAILLNDWEHMTPLWYAQFVEGRWPDTEDVTPVLVSTDRPWLDSVFHYLPARPLYLSGYRPEIAAAGFRIRPRGPFYQVVQPGDASLPPELTVVRAAGGGDLEVLGYELPAPRPQAGDFVPLSLAMRAPEGTEHFYTPVLFIDTSDARLTFEFTTDGHLVTPAWLPGEVIIERFDFALPHDLPEGSYPVVLGLRNLSTGADTELSLSLGSLEVRAQERAVGVQHLLANFRQRVGLVSASGRAGLFQRRRAPWVDPIIVSPGDTVHLRLRWQSLAPAEESYTVFVHLIDQNDRPLAILDYTPLGGSSPTHLWIPKWLPGQQMTDPYRLTIPLELDPGLYFVQVGLYEMTGGRRLHIADPDGYLAGDRYILGAVEVRP